jgi:hypothetical protein
MRSGTSFFGEEKVLGRSKEKHRRNGEMEHERTDVSLVGLLEQYIDK